MSRPTLPELQSRFHRFVVAGDDRFRDDIVDDGRVDVDVRMAVYYDGYRLRLIEALETDFTALKSFLGDEHFDDLARAYIDAHTSDHFSLRHFGRHLEAFLRSQSPWKAQPQLADIACFEWAMTHAFDAADAPLATVADMAAIAPESWPDLTFVLHPSVQRVDLGWNAPALWNAVKQNEPLPKPEAQPYPVGWVLWRQDLQVYFRSLSVDQAWMLDALREGKSFAEICEGLTEWIDAQNVAGHAAGLLRQWLEDGLISEIRS